jgi:hypothetical protein
VRTGENPLLHDLGKVETQIQIASTCIVCANLSGEIHIEIIALREFNAKGKVEIRTCIEMWSESFGRECLFFVVLLPVKCIAETIHPRISDDRTSLGSAESDKGYTLV